MLQLRKGLRSAYGYATIFATMLASAGLRAETNSGALTITNSDSSITTLDATAGELPPCCKNKSATLIGSAEGCDSKDKDGLLAAILGVNSLEGMNIATVAENASPPTCHDPGLLAAVLGVESLEGLKIEGPAASAVATATKPSDEMLAMILGVESLEGIKTTTVAGASEQPELLALILGVNSVEGLNRATPAHDRALIAAAEPPQEAPLPNKELLAAILGVNTLDGMNITNISHTNVTLEIPSYVTPGNVTHDPELIAMILGIDVQDAAALDARPVKATASLVDAELLNLILGIQQLQDLAYAGQQPVDYSTS